MHEINVGTRRVTQYIIEESYKWLYKKILDGEYEVNRCKEGKELLLQIEEAHGVTKSTYKKFLDLFDNSPFEYMLYRSKRKSAKKITTDVLFNYFVKYNGHVLPIGFVKDFFEDDYETKAEVQKLLTEFMESNKSALGISWRRTLLDKEQALDSLRESHPSVLKLHPMLIVTQILKMILTGILTFFIVNFFKSVYFFEVAKIFFTDLGFSLSKKIIAPVNMAAFAIGEDIFCAEGEAFTVLQYLLHYSIFFIIAIILFFVLIARYKKHIRFIIFSARVCINNIRIFRQKMAIQNFEKKGLDKISTYLSEIAPSLAQDTAIDDTSCANIPSEKKLYASVAKFNEKALVAKFAKMQVKYENLKLAYNDKSIHQAKANWRSGLISGFIFTALLSVILVPQLFNMIMPTIFSFVAPLFE
ncbi:MAG: hypothetical protein IJY89_03585 [Clostridia bacterium]|nr:hypothetical protein [Clostridia bacterium]